MLLYMICLRLVRANKMKYIRCSAIMLVPKANYEAWLLSVEILPQLSEVARAELESINLTGMQLNATVIATPPIKKDIEAELNDFVAKNADQILAAEFDRRGLQMSNKPNIPAIELLQNWFDISYHQFMFGLT